MQHLSVGRLPENELQRRFAIQKIAHMNQLIKEFERSAIKDIYWHEIIYNEGK